MSDVVERAKAALEGVTEGPWKAPATLLGTPCTTVFGNSQHVAYFHTGNRPNAEFIAQARTLVPELVAEVERLRKVTDIIDPDSVYREQRDEAQSEVKRLREQVRQMRRQTELFMEDGDRNRLTVALAVSDE